MVGIVSQLPGLQAALGEPASIVLGALASIGALAIRYRYSTEYAAFAVGTVALVAVSPLSTRVLAIHPWFLLGGFLAVQGVGLCADYLYSVVTGKPTGVEAFRTVAASWIDRLRDRRRSVRRRLEAILDRKTVIAVLVGMPLSEFVKVTIVRALAADPVQWRLAWAHLALVIFGLAIGVHWERIKAAAGEAGDQAEEVVGAEPTD